MNFLGSHSFLPLPSFPSILLSFRRVLQTVSWPTAGFVLSQKHAQGVSLKILNSVLKWKSLRTRIHTIQMFEREPGITGGSWLSVSALSLEKQILSLK